MSESNYISERAFRVMFGKKGLDTNSKEEIDTSKGYVKWGKRNDRPQTFIDLYYTSPLHQGIVNGKVSYCTGGGMEIIEGDESAINPFLDNGNSDYTIDEVAAQAALDYFLQGLIVMKLVHSMDGKYNYAETIDADLCRLTDDGKHVLVSQDWSDQRATITTYPVYDVNNSSLVQVIVLKRPSKRLKKELGIYPKPDYEAGIRDIEADKEISNYGLNEILNGFVGGTIINVPTGIPETEEEKKAARLYAEQFTGSDNANSVIVNFSDGAEQAVTVEHLTGNDLQDRYDMVDKRLKNNILMAHGVPSGMLVGIKTEGQLGGSSELETSFNIWNNTRIRHDQRFISEIFNWIMNEVAKVSGVIKLRKATLLPVEAGEQSTITILGNLSPMLTQKILDNMTGNEIRNMIELQPVAGKEVVNASPEGQAFAMTEDEKLIWSSYGRSLKGVDVYFSRDIAHGLDSKGVSKLEPDMMNDFFEEIGTLTAKQKVAAVLDLLNKGERPAEISKIIGSTLSTVMKHIGNLTDNGFLDDQMQLTPKGQRLLKASEVPTEEFEVRYTYELREGIEGPKVIDTTRDFCRELISLNRAFTREEIDNISAQAGRDVFFERGGWYHNPETGRNTPFCRHTWKFILIRRS